MKEKGSRRGVGGGEEKMKRVERKRKVSSGEHSGEREKKVTCGNPRLSHIPYSHKTISLQEAWTTVAVLS